jgi:hypothetical protein
MFGDSFQAAGSGWNCHDSYILLLLLLDTRTFRVSFSKYI